ncbi:sensor histidine kinase [Massilia endophytica]|uniref:sensor histidine kinase n=1 Tax=Massilia endophytica TaxID=2899220 RepID=UPI001E3A1DE3|nr:histidine kinase [Massilia endophytica]UGQ49062.1 histidine kinase [Massilia endophytica]
MRADRIRRVIYTAWFLFWVLMTTTAVQEFLRDDDGPLWHPILWETSSAVVASLFMLAQRRWTRRYDALVAQPAKWFLVQLRWLPLYWVFFVPAAFGIRHAVYAMAGEVYPHAGWLNVYLYEDVKMTIFVAIFIVITFGVLSYQRMQDEKLRAEQSAGLLRSAQLQQLTQQMQPHFLFNALNTISSLMHTDVARADATLIQLADVLRATLDVSGQQQVALSTELRLLRGYTALMCERFADRVAVDWDIESGAEVCTVPVMSLQPLMENVFKHTVEQRRGPVRIKVAARREAGVLALEVEDNTGLLAGVRPRTGSDPGAGIGHRTQSLGPADRGRLSTELPGSDAGGESPVRGLTPASHGIGLRNLRERLAALYGDAATLELTQLAPAGVRAAMRLPCAS